MTALLATGFWGELSSCTVLISIITQILAVRVYLRPRATQPTAATSGSRFAASAAHILSSHSRRFSPTQLYYLRYPQFKLDSINRPRSCAVWFASVAPRSRDTQAVCKSTCTPRTAHTRYAQTDLPATPRPPPTFNHAHCSGPRRVFLSNTNLVLYKAYHPSFCVWVGFGEVGCSGLTVRVGPLYFFENIP